MKKALLIVSLVFVGSSLWAQDFTARPHHVTQNNGPKVAPQAPVEGVVQRMFRSENPLQLINPFASREHGDGSQYVYYDSHDNFQHGQGREEHPKGIKLFAFAW